MPVFGAAPIKETFPEMMDIVSQLVMKWARFGPSHAINVTADFTRLTIDTLALCMMDTRLNSFYLEDAAPYVKAMVGLLSETQRRVYRPWWYTALFSNSGHFEENRTYIRQVASQVIAERRAQPRRKKDLVDAMLHGHDPKTGKQMTEDMIVDNMITFLFAGHETTAGLLSFLFALLLTNPRAYATLQAEIDRVIGSGPMTADHIKDLPYLKACLWETSRLYPSSGIWTVTCMYSDPLSPVVLGKRWEVKSGQTLYIVNPKLHRDPEVWGDDLEEFKPERMLGENFQKLPKNCLKPFGNGQRACIGRAFALQEATVATAVLFQKFDFELVDPEYKITVKQHLASRPHEYFIRAKPRSDVDVLSLQRDLFVGGADEEKRTATSREKADG
ncbi:cytochrome P450 [Xylariomycetidae sp. FL0641]|nr:cytochrome P450 [Xylariomycetidae sp. FL0641]